MTPENGESIEIFSWGKLFKWLSREEIILKVKGEMEILAFVGMRDISLIEDRETSQMVQMMACLYSPSSR